MSLRGRALISLVAAFVLGAMLPGVSAQAQVPDTAGEAAGICDPIDGAKCLLPFPNDLFTTPDPTTATGIRVNFNPLAMPRNVEGKPVDPTEWNRNDGFSPGSVMITYVPGVDLEETGAPPITDMGRSLDAGSPIVLLNAETGERHPFWAELDSHAEAGEQPLLLIHPAVNLDEGATYIVALRDMKDGQGQTIAPSASFLAYRSGTATDARQDHFDEIFAKLAQSGVARDSLYLAWDFTVASEMNLAGRMLHIRDDAFDDYLGDGTPAQREADGTPGGRAPAFKVSKVENNVNGKIARRVTGVFTAPNYLAGGNVCLDPSSSDINCAGGVHNRFNYVGATDAHGEPCTIVDPGCLPAQNPVVPELQANFTCIIPRAALSDGTDQNAQVHPARASLYGHGLLGGASEVNQGQLQDFANEHDFVFCATDWIGMATEDVPNVATILADVSNFPTLADRSQQGMLNFLVLGRLMIHPNGFVSDPAFQVAQPKGPKGVPSRGRPVIDTSALYYDGNSQGGIMGGGLAAVAQDFTHATIGVPGMNYSILLDRSTDFATYYAVFAPNYPDRMDQEIIYALMQMLWDRAEADGYAHHMTTDPYPKTPAHEIIMHVGYGDHQVANVAAEVEARTIGAHVYEPALMDGRSPDVDPHWGLPSVCTPTATVSCDASFPFHGSVIMFWDNCLTYDTASCQTTAPPITNTPPGEVGEDPHEFPRRQAAARLQKATFFQPGGYVIDVCGGKPCLTPTP